MFFSLHLSRVGTKSTCHDAWLFDKGCGDVLWSCLQGNILTNSIITFIPVLGYLKTILKYAAVLASFYKYSHFWNLFLLRFTRSQELSCLLHLLCLCHVAPKQVQDSRTQYNRQPVPACQTDPEAGEKGLLTCVPAFIAEFLQQRSQTHKRHLGRDIRFENEMCAKKPSGHASLACIIQ